jgi:hypothetical protein
MKGHAFSHLANDTLLAAVEAGATKLKVDWANAGAAAVEVPSDGV